MVGEKVWPASQRADVSPLRAGDADAEAQCVRADEKLMESEARFRSAFDHAAIGMTLVSLEGRFLEVNSSLCRIVGYSPQELLETDFQSITYPEDLDADLQFVRRLVADEIDDYQMEKRYVHKDGHLVWVLLSVSLVRDSQRQPLYFISQIQDIDQRKRVEEALRASEDDYRATFESAGVGKVQFELATGKILRVNSKMCQITGYSAGELADKTYADLSHPDDIEMTREMHGCLFRRDVNEATIEKRIIRKDGRVAWISLNISVLKEHPHRSIQGIATIQDITHRKLAEWMEQDRRTILELVAKDAPLGQVLDELTAAVERQVDAPFATVLLICNGTVEIYGRRLPEDMRSALGEHSVALASRLAQGVWADKNGCGVTQVDTDETWAWARDVTRGHQVESCWASSIQSMDGGPLGMLLVFTADSRRPSSGELRSIDTSVKLASICIDHHNTTRQLAHLVRHDALTGLPNRILFEDRLQQAMAVARRSGRGVGLMALDIDKFKTINDTYGHQAGDHLLQQFALRLRAKLREYDTMARLGGDEFVIVLPELLGCNSSAAVAQKLVDCMIEPFAVGEQALSVTTSIGIAIFPTDADDPDTLLKKADAALYRMKNKGRNGYSF